MARLKKGEPRSRNGPMKGTVVLPLDSEKHRPDNYSTLLEYLEGSGQLRQTSMAQLYRARHLYITRGQPVRVVAEEVRVPEYVIDSWVVHFGWKERRNRILYDRFCQVQEIRDRRKEELDDRHDRLALTVEETIERMLHDHHSIDSEFRLQAKDVCAIARAIKELQMVRRTCHDKPATRQERESTIVLDTSERFNEMASMIEGLFGRKPQIEGEQKLIPRGETIDVEFEVVADETRQD